MRGVHNLNTGLAISLPTIIVIEAAKTLCLMNCDRASDRQVEYPVHLIGLRLQKRVDHLSSLVDVFMMKLAARVSQSLSALVASAVFGRVCLRELPQQNGQQLPKMGRKDRRFSTA